MLLRKTIILCCFLIKFYPNKILNKIYDIYTALVRRCSSSLQADPASSNNPSWICSF